MAIKSIINIGFESLEVSAECSLSNGLPSITIVGLASKAVDEAKERLRVAIKNSGFEFPKKRILINLAPADLPKDTTSLDLALAIAVLQADHQLPSNLGNCYFIGELGLDGSIRSIRGLIGKLLHKPCAGAKAVFIPSANAEQASLVGLNNVYPANNLRDLVEHLKGFKSIPLLRDFESKDHRNDIYISKIPDFAEIYEQDTAKRALIVAAAGGHNVLMVGPPGTGKSMLAKAFIGIMPDLTRRQSLEVTHIHSLSSHQSDKISLLPPLRSPHHTASDISIIGGGHILKPGEISLAHHGVLFLDELPEFSKHTIETLRQPLEDGEITIARAQQRANFPADFTLIATSNPCPCGYLYSSKSCTCTPVQITRYQKKLSGPILDRIDIHVTVGQIKLDKLLDKKDAKANPTIKSKVQQARRYQYQRQGEILNGKLNNKVIKEHANLSSNAKTLLDQAAEKLDLSPRSYMKVTKVARTIADLEECRQINSRHIAEALQYRPKNALNIV